MKINMQTMRYINLLHRISKIKTTKCFLYNNAVIFVVPSRLVSKAVGPEGKHIKKIQEQLGKKVKIIKDVNGIEDAARFVEDIVNPVTFVSLEVKDGMFVLTAGVRNKAALLGRGKRRLEELRKIMAASFGKELKIV